MLTSIPAKSEKCKGAMVATAIGDALGWPNERRGGNQSKVKGQGGYFSEWTRKCRKYGYHSERILAGEYSDDTQLTLSVARSIILGDCVNVLAKKELPYWLTYERGGGKALLTAAQECKKGRFWWQSFPEDYYDAGGNGGVMRILPHVIAFDANFNIEDLISDVINDCIITHGHPRAILGATCYAFALYYLLKKESILGIGELVESLIEGSDIWGRFPERVVFDDWFSTLNDKIGRDNYLDEWNRVCSNMINQLKYVKASLEKGLIADDKTVLSNLGCFSKQNGAGDITILSAVYLASKYAVNPVLGIKIPAFSEGADTDTLASITGGLLGMLCGEDWIPNDWKAVQDYDCLIHVTELLLGKGGDMTLGTLKNGNDDKNLWMKTPIGRMKKINSHTIISSNKMIIVNKYQSSLGQTIYAKECQVNSVKKRVPNMQLSIDEIYDPLSKASNAKDTSIILTRDAIEKMGKEKILKNKSFGKILSIISLLFTGDKSADAIAKELKTDKDTVECIKKYIFK